MLTVVCAVWDAKAQAFGQPLFFGTTGLGVRSFTDEVNRKDSALNAHPEDYSFHMRATWDDNLGVFNAFADKLCDAETVIVREFGYSERTLNRG